MALTKIPGNLIETGAITAAALDNDAVTTAKILDANITHAKLHTSMDLTGKTVTVATAAGSTNTTAAASTAFVQQELTTLIGGAPGTLDTLNELAAAINDDSNYNTTLTTALATKLPLAGGELSGTLNITQASTADTIKLTRSATSNNNMIKFRSAGADKWIVGQRNDSTEHFRFYSYGTSSDVLSIQTDGKVGIGTDTPSEELHVNSAVSGQHTRVHITKTSTAGTAGVSFRSKDASNTWTLYQEDANASKFYIYDGGASVMTFDSANNSVGIGTDTPLAPLDVVRGGTTGLSSVNARTALLVQNNLSNGTVLSINAKNTGYSGIFLGDQDNEAICQIQYVHTDDKLKFFTNGGGYNPLTLSGTNVGIGTASPDTKLHVFKATAGSITDYADNALIVENSTDVGISLLTPNANAGHIMFGSPGHQYHSYIRGGYGASTTSTLKFFTDQINTMTHKAGKVGIGTDDPTNKLTVYNANGTAALFRRSGSSGPVMQFQAGAAAAGNIAVQSTGLGFGGGTTENKIFIDTAGSVGLGTTNPLRSFDSRHALNIFGSGGYTELMLRGRAGTAQNLGAFHWSIRADVGGNNDDLKLLRFTGGNSPSYAGIAMQIQNSTGNVGIGTDNPTHPAHIQGTSNDTIDETKGTIKVQASGGNGLIFGTIASSPYTSYIQSAYVQDTSVAQYGLALNPLGANVGIGTTSPLAVLEIDPPAVDTPIFAIRRQDNATIPLFKFFQDSSVSQGTGHAHMNSANRDLSITTDANSTKTNGIYIKTTGEVGIGIDSPTAKLHVQTTTQADTTVAQLELATTVNANPSHINQKFTSGAGWIGMIQAEQRAAGQYGALNFWTANNGNPTQKMTLNNAGDLSVGETGVQDGPHPLHKVVEVTAAAATANSWSTNSGSNGGYDVSGNDSGTSSNRGSISAAGYYNHHVAHFSLRGNFSANTWYPFTTRSQLQSWIPGASSSSTTGIPMYFRVYTYDISGGGGDYLSNRLTDRFWFNTYGSNSNQRHHIPLGPAMGHAPNSGAYTDHKDYSNNNIQMTINHRYGSDSYYPGSQTFDILFKSARTGLNGSSATQVEIYAYIG